MGSIPIDQPKMLLGKRGSVMSEAIENRNTFLQTLKFLFYSKITIFIVIGLYALGIIIGCIFYIEPIAYVLFGLTVISAFTYGHGRYKESKKTLYTYEYEEVYNEVYNDEEEYKEEIKEPIKHDVDIIKNNVENITNDVENITTTINTRLKQVKRKRNRNTEYSRMLKKHRTSNMKKKRRR